MAPVKHHRLQREAKTVEKMIALFCCAHHKERQLCAACTQLLDTALNRLAKCPFGSDKPACNHCRVHCYPDWAREKIRTVMRYAGPRLIWHHPILTIRHLWDARQGRHGS